MTKEATPHIDREAEFALSLPLEQRRRLPFAAPVITESTRFRVSEAERVKQNAPAPQPKNP